MNHVAASADPSTLRIRGAAAPIASLSGQMDETPELMAELMGEFAKFAENLPTQQAYWLGLNGWMTDRLSAPIFEGATDIAALKAQAWAIYVSSYWGGMELRNNWGMPPVMQRLGITMAPPYASVQQAIADNMSLRLEALAAGGERCLELLPRLMRDNGTSGAIYPIAYNAGVQVVKIEDPPLGQRRRHRPGKPAAVRINKRDFMRVDYELPAPGYLRKWRSAFEQAVTANPQAYEQAILGAPGEQDIRDIWQAGVVFGHTTWGGDANDKWTAEYFDETVHWSSVLNFGLEAVGLAAFVAVINRDPEAARCAVMGNTLYAGATPGWLIGLLDTEGALPALHAG